MPARTAIDIAHPAAAGAPSPDHKQFQTLLARIEQARLRLQRWHEQLPLFAHSHQQRAQPVLTRLAAARRTWAFELEQLLLQRKWSKTDQLTLAEMVCELAGPLLRDGDDAPLKALYNRVAELDFDTQDQQHTAAMQAALEAMAELETGVVEPVTSTAGRGKAGKTRSAAQLRAQAEATRVSQTVREVYRKLASALHPDRAEAGATPQQQAERTDRMARANAAYAAGDLLSLLTLQLQIEQVDVAHAVAVTATQVRHFNKLLAAQLDGLQADIDGRQHAFSASYGVFSPQRMDPLKLGVLLQAKLHNLLAQEAALAAQQRLLRGDAATARLYLKRWRQQGRLHELFA